ncbi:hypothetical protein N656DRAFT_181027 [Canariomyces notabilis]|uniref:C2H2-type domain-containing protein n=1 Tax=Canariomyces notabilis TaxID=2074819 RepID=A0AAN6QIE7_9PEZI|nr:hypothetical protein N656DRAFT_181027 [Canariomyces arenarius]
MPHLYNSQPEVPIASHHTMPLSFSESQTSQTTSDGSDSEGSSSVTSTRDNYFPCHWKDPKEPNLPKCQKICSTREKLRKHRLKHSRPKNCTYCDYTAAGRKDIDRHKAVHHPNEASEEGVNKRQSVCPLCGQKGRYDNIKRHIRTRHKGKI